MVRNAGEPLHIKAVPPGSRPRRAATYHAIRAFWQGAVAGLGKRDVGHDVLDAT
jgi:hypothetical protein